MNIWNSNKEERIFSLRLIKAQKVVYGFFLILFIRHIQLQLFQGKEYQKKSEKNFVKILDLPPPRGMILDREGRILATNRPSYNIYITPYFFNKKNTLKLFARYFQLSKSEVLKLKKRLSEKKGLKQFQPFLAYKDVEWEKIVVLKTHQKELPGLEVKVIPLRIYPYGKLTAHVVGYMNEVTAEEIKRWPQREYKLGDMIGRVGIERRFEKYLRGKRGWQKIEVNAKGIVMQENKALPKYQTKKEPTSGYNLISSIDIVLQRIVNRAIKPYPAGAVVVLNPNNGKILAWLSKPQYDPNLFVKGITQKQQQELMKDPLRPAIDRVVREHYFPGSTYKVISALAALQEGLIDPNDTVICNGYYEIGHRRFKCSEIHGRVNLKYGIIRSCNIYFYKLGELVGMDRLARYAFDFGLGRRTGIRLNSEVEGFIPTRKWYLARYSNKFRIGFTLNNIIGQGDTKVTPLHLGLVYAAIINGGRLFFPQILERIETPSGRVIQNFPSRLKRHISVSSSNLAHIIEALIGVVHDPSGTAFESSLKNIKVGGKTGTAQTPNKYGKNSDRKMWFFNLDHAWFVAFAPAENPEIVVTVLIEHGGGASKTAVPVGMKIIQTYFERTKGIEIPTIATKEIKKKRFKQGPALISIRKY